MKEEAWINQNIRKTGFGNMPELYNDVYDEFFLAPVTQEDVGTAVNPSEGDTILKRQFRAALPLAIKLTSSSRL